jgi:hypothetical protein
MRPVAVVEILVFAQRVQKVPLAPDQRAVEQLAAAGTHPPFHDRVHPGYLDTAAYDGDAGVGGDPVEQRRVFVVPVADEVIHLAAGVFKVHDEVPGCLGHPSGGRVCGGAQDADAAAGVFDDGEAYRRVRPIVSTVNVSAHEIPQLEGSGAHVIPQVPLT